MGGITGGPLSRQPIQVVSVEHEGTDEILNRFVRADGKRCVVDERPIGVGQASSTKDGEVVPVATSGIVTVEAGAAIALCKGERAVRTDAEGRAVAHGGERPIAGYVIDAASAKGDLVRCILP